jgi:hypothetical protein
MLVAVCRRKDTAESVGNMDGSGTYISSGLRSSSLSSGLSMSVNISARKICQLAVCYQMLVRTRSSGRQHTLVERLLRHATTGIPTRKVSVHAICDLINFKPSVWLRYGRTRPVEVAASCYVKHLAVDREQYPTAVNPTEWRQRLRRVNSKEHSGWV